MEKNNVRNLARTAFIAGVRNDAGYLKKFETGNDADGANKKGEKKMIDPKMTDQLTNPYDGIRAVCPKCKHETPGTFAKHPTGGPYRAFECFGCGLRYQVDDADVKGVMIGSRVDGYNSDFKKRAMVQPKPATAKKPEPVVKQPVQQPETPKPAAIQSNDDLNPVIGEALRRAEDRQRAIKTQANPLIGAAEKTANFFKRGDVDNV